MKLWQSIDRWGPLTVALLSLLALIHYAWMTDQRIAKLEGMVQARLQMEGLLRFEIQSWQAYCTALSNKMVEYGVKDLPRPPTPKGE